MKVKISLEEQMDIFRRELFENVRPLEEIEHFSSVEFVVLVQIVDLESNATGILGFWDCLLIHEFFGAFGQTATTILLHHGQLAAPMGSVRQFFIFFSSVDVAIIDVVQNIRTDHLVFHEYLPFLSLNLNIYEKSQS